MDVSYINLDIVTYFNDFHVSFLFFIFFCRFNQQEQVSSNATGNDLLNQVLLMLSVCFDRKDSTVIYFIHFFSRCFDQFLSKRNPELFQNSRRKRRSAVPAANSALSPRPSWKCTSRGTWLNPPSNASSAVSPSAVPIEWPVTFNRTTRKSLRSLGRFPALSGLYHC